MSVNPAAKSVAPAYEFMARALWEYQKTHGYDMRDYKDLNPAEQSEVISIARELERGPRLELRSVAAWAGCLAMYAVSALCLGSMAVRCIQ